MEMPKEDRQSFGRAKMSTKRGLVDPQMSEWIPRPGRSVVEKCWVWSRILMWAQMPGLCQVWGREEACENTNYDSRYYLTFRERSLRPRQWRIELLGSVYQREVVVTDLACGFRLSLSDMYSTTITSLASKAEKEESTNSRDSVCLRKLKCHTHDNHRFPGGTTGNPMNTTQCKHRRQQRTAQPVKQAGSGIGFQACTCIGGDPEWMFVWWLGYTEMHFSRAEGWTWNTQRSSTLHYYY